jgi:predicted MPP superfamily phosphohydrolase
MTHGFLASPGDGDTRRGVGPAMTRTPPRTGGITRRDLLRTLTAVGAGTAVGASAFGFLYERHHIEITRTPIAVTGLPDALTGLRVGFLTDLHRSATVPAALIQSAVQLLMQEQPDIIVLGGDYVTYGDRRFVPRVAEDLAPLSAPHGVFAVLGNHDDDRDMPAALTQRGIEVLRDARTRLAVRGETLDIIGIRYWTRKLSDLTRLARGAAPATMFVAHTPSRLTEAAQLGLPLMLSGHTHGGQVVLPVVGAVAARNFPIVAGRGSLDGTAAFVSRGVGTVYVPIRLDCPPEVAVLTLKPADPT